MWILKSFGQLYQAVFELSHCIVLLVNPALEDDTKKEIPLRRGGQGEASGGQKKGLFVEMVVISDWTPSALADGDAAAGQRLYLPVHSTDRCPTSGKMDLSHWADLGGFIQLGYGLSWGPGSVGGLGGRCSAWTNQTH